LSQCYYNLKTVVDDCGAEVYLHAFSETALDGDVPLTSNYVLLFPTERTTTKHCIRSMAGEPGRRIGQDHALAQLWEPINVRTDCRLVNTDSEVRRIQTKYPYMFGLYSSAVSGGKERFVCYLMELYLISSSGTAACIQGIYSVVQNV
jgi:hypothetical protein